jgi:hypothetical protein
MAPRKHPDDFSDLDTDLTIEQDDTLEFHEDDSHFDDEPLAEGEYDDEELERRRVAYSDLKRNDKIFGNTYNLGYETNDEDDNSSKASSSIKLESGSAEFAMSDPDRYADHVDYTIVQRDIYNFIQSCDELQVILGDEPEKQKFTKPQINQIFSIILKGLTIGSNTTVFITPIQVLESISSTLNMEYKKIFDMLTYENKELLLIELNSKYGFLDGMGKNYKIF